MTKHYKTKHERNRIETHRKALAVSALKFAIIFVLGFGIALLLTK